MTMKKPDKLARLVSAALQHERAEAFKKPAKPLSNRADADAALIVAMHAALPKLLAVVEAARAHVKDPGHMATFIDLENTITALEQSQ